MSPLHLGPGQSFHEDAQLVTSLASTFFTQLINGEPSVYQLPAATVPIKGSARQGMRGEEDRWSSSIPSGGRVLSFARHLTFLCKPCLSLILLASPHSKTNASVLLTGTMARERSVSHGKVRRFGKPSILPPSRGAT